MSLACTTNDIILYTRHRSLLSTVVWFFCCYLTKGGRYPFLPSCYSTRKGGCSLQFALAYCGVRPYAFSGPWILELHVKPPVYMVALFAFVMLLQAVDRKESLLLVLIMMLIVLISWITMVRMVWM